jgi:hypothetical protein
MKPSKDRPAKQTRPEFGAPARGRPLGRPLRQQRTPRRWPDFSDVSSTAAAHGEDIAAEHEKPLPPEDRAG